MARRRIRVDPAQRAVHRERGIDDLASDEVVLGAWFGHAKVLRDGLGHLGALASWCSMTGLGRGWCRADRP
jgi:hypothetical protein